MINEAQFRKNLRLIRNSRGYSAEILGMMAQLKGKKRILDIEEGRVPCHLKELSNICQVLRVSMDQILTMEAVAKIEWKPITEEQP
jgi:DNA-binding XRE family transcriptional regulator